jgi:hypothetical protein
MLETTRLLSHLPSDLRQTGLAVLALGLYSSVTQHLDDLSVLCPSALPATTASVVESVNTPCPSSLKISSRLFSSASFFPLLLFFPP